jgi:hypothetical protein
MAGAKGPQAEAVAAPTSYSPINPDVYALAFQGAQSGITTFQVTNTDTTVADYSQFSVLAQAWAQTFDIAWGKSTRIDEVQAFGIMNGSFGFWAGSNTASPFITIPSVATFTPYVNGIIATIASSEANFASLNIVPPLWGGNSSSYTTTTGSFVQPAILTNISVPVVLSNWMVAGEVVYITNGGYYKVISVTNTTSVVLQNLGYTGNAAPAATVPANSGVGPSGLQGLTGPAVGGLTPSQILFGSISGTILQSLGISWNDTTQTLSLGGAGSYGSLGTATLSPWNFTPNLASGVNFQLQPATVPTGVFGTNVNIYGGASTSLQGGQINIIAGAGGTAGGGGLLILEGGQGGTGGTSACTGGGLLIRGGVSNASTASGGSISIQPGASFNTANNGTLKLYDGNGALALQVQNGTNVLDAPLVGDSATNNPLCFGIANVTVPTTVVNSTYQLTLSNTQYNCYCIRMSGTVTNGGAVGNIITIIFPNHAGGYTKILDLTQVPNISISTAIIIEAGASSTVISGPTASIYTVNYDGTTITCNQPPAGKVATSVGNTLQGTAVFQTLAQASITIGSSGSIIAHFSAYCQTSAANIQLQTRMLLDSVVASPSTLVQNVNFVGSQTMNSTYPFTGLTPGNSHTVAIQVYSSSTSASWWSTAFTLLSP